MGPSGSGKGTLLSDIRLAFPELAQPTSWTTRLPREGERDGEQSTSGKKYHFVSTEEFLKAIERGFFLEWDQHFNNYYGTPAGEVTEALAQGKTVLHELEINGVKQLLTKLPRAQVKIIFVTAGSWDELVQRVFSREAIAPDELEKRRQHYEEEVQFADNADYVLENKSGQLEETKQKFAELIRTIIKS